MISSKTVKFLDKSKVKYEKIEHKVVFTAYDKAATLRVKPNVIGKTLVLKTDPSAQLRAGNNLVMALIPGNKNLDKNKFKTTVSVWRKKQGQKPAKSVDFISETVMKNKFKGFKIGSIPPFGELFKIPAFIDGGLLKEKNIFVATGCYDVSLKISPKVFEKMGAVKGNFSKAK